jgi:hypothetical protein
MRASGKEARVALETIAALYAAVVRRVRGQKRRYREILAYVKEDESAVSSAVESAGPDAIDVVFESFCRLLFASIDMATIKAGPWRDPVSVMKEMRGSFDSVMPPPQTMYLSLGFARGVDVHAAMGDDRATARLVAYALFHELGAPEPTLHFARFEDGSVALVVYADCIDGEWTIYSTPMGRSAAKLVFKKAELRLARPKRSPVIFRVGSERVVDAGNTRTWVALSLLGRHTPIAVPDATSIGSTSAQSPILREYENAQLELYRRIARTFPRPYKRFGRTLLSLLRTWSVVDDTVVVDRALMDVIHKDGVALTHDELKVLVSAATDAFAEFDDSNDAIKKVTDVTCTGADKMVQPTSNKAHVEKSSIDALNKELAMNEASLKQPGKHFLMLSMPAVELAARVGAGKSALEVSSLSDGGMLAEVRKWNLEAGGAAAVVVSDQRVLLNYWALVYRMLVWQTKNAERCLGLYTSWYKRAFESKEPAYVVWDPPAVQTVGTVPLMAYVRAKPVVGVSLLGRPHRVARAFQRTSRDSFRAGELVEGRMSVTWDKAAVSLRDVCTEAELYGPFYTEAELTREGGAARKLHTRANGDKFRVKCKRERYPEDDPGTPSTIWSTRNLIAAGVVVGIGAGGVAAGLLSTPLALTGLVTANLVNGAVGIRDSLRPISADGAKAADKKAEGAEDGKAKLNPQTMGFEESQSAGTAVLDDAFDMRSFLLDASVEMCSTALQNAYIAAGLLAAP